MLQDKFADCDATIKDENRERESPNFIHGRASEGNYYTTGGTNSPR